jgi:hypothetical protein
LRADASAGAAFTLFVVVAPTAYERAAPAVGAAAAAVVVAPGVAYALSRLPDHLTRLTVVLTIVDARSRRGGDRVRERDEQN